jgi:hypothetical protein
MSLLIGPGRWRGRGQQSNGGNCNEKPPDQTGHSTALVIMTA